MKDQIAHKCNNKYIGLNQNINKKGSSESIGLWSGKIGFNKIMYMFFFG